jgi:hypothetical protein
MVSVVGHVEAQQGAAAVILSVVDAVLLEEGVVDVAGALAVEADQAQRDLVVGQGNVDQAVGFVVQALGARGVGQADVGGAFELVARLLVDDAQGAAHRTRAVERALRAAQDFNAIHVEQAQFRGRAAGVVARTDRTGHRRFVVVGADGRSPAA